MCERCGREATHRLAETRRHAGEDPVAVVRCRLDDRFRANGRLLALEDARPTKTPSAPSCMQSAASAGVAMPPAEGHHRQPSVLRHPLHVLVRRGQLLGLRVELLLAQRLEADAAENRAHVTNGVDDVAGAGFALGGSSRRLRPILRSASPSFDSRTRTGRGSPTCRCGAPRPPASAPRSRRCSRPRGPRGSAPRRSARSALSPSRGSSRTPGSPGLVASAMRATPPSARMSAGTRSSAMTATAPASSAMRACSAVVTSMMTPPLSISARPDLTRMVPSSAMAKRIAMERAVPAAAGSLKGGMMW